MLGVTVLCNTFQGDLHCKESETKQIFHSLSKKCSKSDRLGWKHCRNGSNYSAMLKLLQQQKAGFTSSEEVVMIQPCSSSCMKMRQQKAGFTSEEEAGSFSRAQITAEEELGLLL